jgi:O-antigen chain-terminating methyltransferase
VRRHAALLFCFAVASQSERAARLAEEIRAAVGASSPGSPPRVPVAGGVEEGARSALERAMRHLTPSVPEGAPLARAKRAALRLLRFVWRDQSAYNALSLEAVTALAEAVAAQNALLERLRQDSVVTEQAWGARRAELDRVSRELAAGQRRAAVHSARLAALETPGARAAAEPPRPASAIPFGVYSVFEERFRGASPEVRAKQEVYLEFLRDPPGPVLDVGCGRGEFLRLLSENGIAAAGAEINPLAVAECREAGLAVEEEDALAALARRASGSLGGVVAFQVVEHWTPEATFAFLREARRALSSDGTIILETINVDSLSTWRTFYLDPSHVRPVPPQALQFLVEAAGFADAQVRYAAPLPPQERLTEETDNNRKLNELLFGPQDYAVIARTPAITD